MRRVEVTHVAPGALLAQPVLDSLGRVLLSAGAPLTTTVIACLERWRISTVTIKEAEDCDDAPCKESHAERLREHWERLFGPHQSDPEVALIHSALERWQEARSERQETRP